MGLPLTLLVLGGLGGALLGPPAALAATSQSGTSSTRTMECFEYGYDYYGYDMQEVSGVPSPGACMQECMNHKGCGFWSYSTYTLSCYLKSVGAVLERRPSPGIISGPRQCSYSTTCFEPGIDLFGYDIESIEGRYIMNPVDCQRLCEANPQCAFFSWRFSNHSCYLKSSPAILNRREDPDVTSGPRSCVGSAVTLPSPEDYPTPFDPETAPPPCVLAGVDLRGHNVKTAKARSPAACQMLCLKHRDCEYWTWSTHSHICSLKNADALSGRSEGQHTLDKVSGAKRCIPVVPGCQFVDVGVVGAVLSKRSVASFDLCQIHCAAFSGCTHFSFDLKSGDCNLWSSFNTYSKGITTDGLVSGRAFCDAEEICFEQADYVGHNVEENETGEVDSPAACQAMCQHNADCHYWTWLNTNKGCYLKDADALEGRTNDPTALGRYSGPKYCNMSYGCLSINAVYSGMSLQTTETEDYLLCSSKCAEHPFCTAWTYHGDMRLCSLFSGEPTLLSKPVRGAVSALKNCFQQEEEEQSCFDEGIQYPLDNVVKIASAGSAHECYLLCGLESTCSKWTFKSGDTCVMMKNADSDSSTSSSSTSSSSTSSSSTSSTSSTSGSSGSGDVVYDPASVSGPKLCSEMPLLSGPASFKGTPLRVSSVFSPKGCAEQCLQNPQCRYWSFLLGKETNCQLYSKIETLETQPNCISGFVPRVLLASNCSYPEETIVATVFVTSVETCSSECVANPRCRAWSAVVEPSAALAQLNSSSSSLTPAGTSAASTDEVTCHLHSDDNTPSYSFSPRTFCGTSLNPKTLRKGKTYTVIAGDEIFSNPLDLVDCPTHCASNPDCLGWSYDVQRGCLGFDSIDAEEENTGAISAPVDRPAPALRFNIAFVGGDTITPASSRAAAATKSSAAPFRSLRIGIVPTSSAGAVAAAGAAPTAPVPALYPFTPNKKIAPSYNDCITACTKELACVAWTFKEGACTLFSNTEGTVFEPNVISGTRSIQQPLPWDFAVGQKYAADPLVSFPTGPITNANGDVIDGGEPLTPIECAERAAADQCWSFDLVAGRCFVYGDCAVSEEAQTFVSGISYFTAEDIATAEARMRGGKVKTPAAAEGEEITHAAETLAAHTDQKPVEVGGEQAQQHTQQQEQQQTAPQQQQEEKDD